MIARQADVRSGGCGRLTGLSGWPERRQNVFAYRQSIVQVAGGQGHRGTEQIGESVHLVGAEQVWKGDQLLAFAIRDAIGGIFLILIERGLDFRVKKLVYGVTKQFRQGIADKSGKGLPACQGYGRGRICDCNGRQNAASIERVVRNRLNAEPHRPHTGWCHLHAR